MGILVQPGRGIPHYFRHCVVMKLLLHQDNYEGLGYPEGHISREDLLEYLENLRLREMDPYPGMESQENGPMKLKRGWRSRWGNKYADNKSYGFWITALNKAGNYKRGKRGEPFVPGLSSAEPPFNIIRALKGGNTAPLKELVADHDYTEEQNTN